MKKYVHSEDVLDLYGRIIIGIIVCGILAAYANANRLPVVVIGGGYEHCTDGLDCPVSAEARMREKLPFAYASVMVVLVSGALMIFYASKIVQRGGRLIQP